MIAGDRRPQRRARLRAGGARRAGGRGAAADGGGRRPVSCATGASSALPAAEVVPGDVLLLAEGDAVSADARLVEAASLTVAEASLTGESEAVLKDVAPLTAPAGLGDRLNMVFNGTAVTRGRGRAVVTATGMATEMGNVARLLGSTEEERTPLQREVDRIGRMLGHRRGRRSRSSSSARSCSPPTSSTPSDVVDVLLVGVSLAVAAVPEGLPAVLSVVLALGVQRMARRHAIVKKLSSVETLGSASVICSDKTGTLTKNEMTIEKVVTAVGRGRRHRQRLPARGRAARQPGGALDDGAAGRGARRARRREPGQRRRAARGRRRVDDPGRSDRGRVPRRRGEGRGPARSAGARFERVGEVPFTSERKLMSTVAGRPRGRARRRRRHQGRAGRAARRCTAERVGRRGAAAHGGAPARGRSPTSTASPTSRCARSPSPTGRCPATTQPAAGRVDRAASWSTSGSSASSTRRGRRRGRRSPRRTRAGIRVIMITGDHPAHRGAHRRRPRHRRAGRTRR